MWRLTEGYGGCFQRRAPSSVQPTQARGPSGCRYRLKGGADIERRRTGSRGAGSVEGAALSLWILRRPGVAAGRRVIVGRGSAPATSRGCYEAVEFGGQG